MLEIALIYWCQRDTGNQGGKKMTNMEVRKEIKALVIRKGLNNIINADLNEIRNRTGATVTQMQNAISYFQYSPQTAKYR